MSNQMNAKKIVIGAVIGGAVAAIAVSLLSSKNTNTIRNTCEEYGDKIKTLINEISHNIAGNINDKKTYMTDKTNEIIESIKDEVGSFDLENKDFRKGLIIGGILGGLLGSGTTYACKGGSEEAQSAGWKKVAKDVLEVLDTNGHSKHETPKYSNTVHDVFDFAVSGIQLWKNMHKK